jgi:hypothetical protein
MMMMMMMMMMMIRCDEDDNKSKGKYTNKQWSRTMVESNRVAMRIGRNNGR